MLEKFKNYLILNNIKPNSYIWRIKLFLKYNLNITQEIIDAYLVKQSNSGLGAETINMDVKALKKLCKFLAINIKFPPLRRGKKRIPETITLDYFEKEIIPVAGYVFKNPLKTKALLYFMLYTGVRKSELIPLKREHIDINKLEVKIQNIKSNKEEIKPFSKKIVPFLKLYFNAESEKNNAFNTSLSKVDYLFKVLKHYTKKRLYPHILRRSIATKLFEEGASLEVIRDFLGHENIETTIKYLGRNRAAMHTAYHKFLK